MYQKNHLQEWARIDVRIMPFRFLNACQGVRIRTIRTSALAFYTCQLTHEVRPREEKKAAVVMEIWCSEDGKTGR